MKTVLTKHPRRWLSLVLIVAAIVTLLGQQFFVPKDPKPTPELFETKRTLKSVEPAAESTTSTVTTAASNPSQPQANASNRAANKSLASNATTASVNELEPSPPKENRAAKRPESSQDVEGRDQHFAESETDQADEEKERKHDEPDQAMKWRMGAMVDETGKIPHNAEVRAWLQAKKMRIEPGVWPAEQMRMGDKVAGINPTGWQWLGPGNIGGRVRAIIIHPGDPQTLWLGSVSGGIWKSINGGVTWAPLADFMANLAVSSMVIDPTNPNVLYAGTGEGFFNGDSIRGAGVFKTTDGGATWNQLPQTTTSDWYYVDRLAISPVNSQIILAATRSGIWRSTDGGATWSRPLTLPSIFDVNFHPTDGNLAIASGTAGVASFSNDGGVTWNAATGISGQRVEVAYARSNPTIVYASVESNGGEIYKSTDGGQTYSLVSTPQHLEAQGWYDNALWVDPTNPDNVVIGGIFLYRSLSGGVLFERIGSLHPDQHIIVEAPGFDGSSNKTVYFGNDGGIYRTTDINSIAVTTTDLNNNLGITQFYGGAGNATSGRIIGGTQDNGTLRYTGTTEGWNFMAGGDGGWCASDPADPNYFYGEFQWLQLHRSTNGGASSQSIYFGITDADSLAGTTNFIAPFILDPNNPNRLLAGGANLWRTNNAKGAVPLGWVSIKNPIGSNISAIAVAKGNSDIIWVGHNNGNIYVSTNGTSETPTWTQVDTNAPGLPNGRRNTRIAIDPTNADRVYATFGGFTPDNVWRTDNAGASWTNITNNLPAAPVRSIVVWQGNPNNLYLGTEVGVFASANQGQSWSPSNDGPTNCSVDELFWMGNTLVAATHGRGMFSINISTGQPPVVSITNPTEGANFTSGANITIEATANDPDGSVSKIDFYYGANLIGTDSTSPFSIVWNSAPSGSHVLTAKATDNGGDSAVSVGVNITVAGGSGSNNNFANAQPLSGETDVVVGNNFAANKEPGEPNHAGNIGGASVWYTWQAPATGAAAISTAGSSFDTLLAVYTGNSVGGLAVVASNDDEPGLLTSKVDFNAVAGQVYRIAVDGYNVGSGAETGTIVLTLVHFSLTPTIQFTLNAYSVAENGGAATINVFRSGPHSSAATVNYATSDNAGLANCSVVNGVASARCDYITSRGTTRFAVGETSKTISIPIVDDAYAEGSETFTIQLSNVTGAILGAPTTATITIQDNEVVDGTNPIDGTPFFVRQQYLDFLNREPDPGGFGGWQAIINGCAPGDTTCDRIHVSSAFFRSPEFQERGYFVYRFYPVSFGRKPDFAEFTLDIAKVSGFLTDAELEAARVAFVNDFMSRPAFVTKYNGLSNTAYVDTLLATAVITHPTRDSWITSLNGGTKTRAQVLREIVESVTVFDKYFNQAFVVMQYFGYLRREPDALYTDWIQILDSTNDFRGMVNGFMNSPEYRIRFGP